MSKTDDNNLPTIILNDVCELLDSHKGRDKVLRTLCYVSKLIGSLQTDCLLEKKFEIFSKQMSATRATLRLLDDLPMLKYALEYGIGENEPDRFMAAIGVTTNIIDHIFYPIEKIAWAAEYGLTTVEGRPWEVASTVCWVASCYLNFVKSMRYFFILSSSKEDMKVSGNREEVEKITAQEKMEVLTCVRLVFDFVHAVQSLPSGFLWSGKLSPVQVGLVGTVSSLIGIFQVFFKKYSKIS